MRCAHGAVWQRRSPVADFPLPPPLCYICSVGRGCCGSGWGPDESPTRGPSQGAHAGTVLEDSPSNPAQQWRGIPAWVLTCWHLFYFAPLVAKKMHDRAQNLSSVGSKRTRMEVTQHKVLHRHVLSHTTLEILHRLLADNTPLTSNVTDEPVTDKPPETFRPISHDSAP